MIYGGMRWLSWRHKFQVVHFWILLNWIKNWKTWRLLFCKLVLTFSPIFRKKDKTVIVPPFPCLTNSVSKNCQGRPNHFDILFASLEKEYHDMRMWIFESISFKMVYANSNYLNSNWNLALNYTLANLGLLSVICTKLQCAIWRWIEEWVWTSFFLFSRHLFVLVVAYHQLDELATTTYDK